MWLNGGSGTFTLSNQTLGSTSSQAVSLGDLDGDADLDAFVANFGASNRIWLNAQPPVLDVNADGFGTPIDGLLIINFINANGGGVPVFQAPSPPPFLNTNGSGTITSIDALLVINFLNARTLDGGGEDGLVSEGEGGSAELGSTRLTVAGNLDSSLAVDFSSSVIVSRKGDNAPIEVWRHVMKEEEHDPLLAPRASPLSHEPVRPVIDRFEWADLADPTIATTTVIVLATSGWSANQMLPVVVVQRKADVIDKQY